MRMNVCSLKLFGLGPSVPAALELLSVTWAHNLSSPESLRKQNLVEGNGFIYSLHRPPIEVLQCIVSVAVFQGIGRGQS